MGSLNLSELDYIILNHINDYASIDYLEVIDLVGIDGAERISNLLSLGVLEDVRGLTKPDDKSEDLGLFTLTYKGHVILNNYSHSQKQLNEKQKSEFWDKMFFSFVIPIIVTIITTIIIDKFI